MTEQDATTPLALVVPDALQRETLLRRAGTHATSVIIGDMGPGPAAHRKEALRPGHESDLVDAHLTSHQT